MEKNRKMANGIVKTATMAAVFATLVGTAMSAGIMTDGTAYAAETKSNDITISAAKSTGSSQAPSLTGRTLRAYRIATYKNVQLGSGADAANVVGYDLAEVDANIHNAVIDGVKAAVLQGGNVKPSWGKLVSNDKGNLKFIGDAAGLSAEQFVARYFYGTGSDAYANTNADGKHSETLTANDGTLATSTEIRDFANNLESVSLGTGINGTISQDGTSVTFDVKDGEEGVYLIVDASGSNQMKSQTVSRAMIVGSAFKNGTKLYDTLKTANQGNVTMGRLNLKADAVTVSKDVVGNDHLIQIGSARTFQIDTNVPNYKADYQNWEDVKDIEFSVADNPTDNLDVTTGATNVIKNIKVQSDTGGDGAYQTVDASKYTVVLNTATANDPNDFTVRLKAPADFSGNRIRITYDATVTDLADTTENNAVVTFSNDPKDHSKTTTTPPDSGDEKLYETELNLDKVKFNDAKTKLDGARFDVSVNGKPVLFSTPGTDGAYKVDKAGKNQGIVLNSAQHSPTVIKGLASDTDGATTYHFKETAAPAGYILGENPVEFDVVVTPAFGKDGELTGVKYQVNGGNHKNFLDLGALKGDGTALDATLTQGTTKYASGILDIENTTNIKDFAKTGGQIAGYVAAAAALAVAGAFLGVMARRNRDRNIAA